MALLSPGIQIFESSVTPAAAVAPAENGVATLGFAKKGPVNKLTRIRSVSEFNEIFGDPVDPQYYAHILAQSVLANGTDVYFYRLADGNNLEEAQCPVIADYKIEGARVAFKNDVDTATFGYFALLWKEATTNPVTGDNLKVRITVNDYSVDPSSDEYIRKIYAPAYFADKFGDITKGDADKIIYASLNEVREALAAEAGDIYNFTIVNKEDEVGILVSAKNETAFNNSSVSAADLTAGISFGYLNDSGVWAYIDGSLDGDNAGSAAGTGYGTVTKPVELLEADTDTFNGESIHVKSTLSDFTGTSDYSCFNIVARNPGSGMNGVKIVKSTVKSSIKPYTETWTVSVYNAGSSQVAEERAGITPENFLAEMSKFELIDIKDIALKEDFKWYDGTWELGVGAILADGTSWVPGGEETVYVAVEGKDGFPTVSINDEPEYSEDRAVDLYLEALGNDDFINTDEFSYSILATPGIQRTLVQNAAINVCATRGDAIYLADVPSQYCLSKQGIDEAVAWANGNSGFQSSYCAIYYGWFYQTNPYNTESNIACPASCFIAPKMVALDQSMGEFFAPAGIARGGLICSDWSYSPDQKDRDKLVGNDNVINPISYSSTRGVTIMAQKTTDRTTSPLNRVGIRRMTNAIKRNLRSQLVALLFEPNNETARARARVMVDNIMSNLRTRECIESYDINVVSGTGANRNDLNVYLSYAPYGLIEKIYVYLSITDAGVEVTEAVA